MSRSERDTFCPLRRGLPRVPSDEEHRPALACSGLDLDQTLIALGESLHGAVHEFLQRSRALLEQVAHATAVIVAWAWPERGIPTGALDEGRERDLARPLDDAHDGHLALIAGTPSPSLLALLAL